MILHTPKHMGSSSIGLYSPSRREVMAGKPEGDCGYCCGLRNNEKKGSKVSNVVLRHTKPLPYDCKLVTTHSFYYERCAGFCDTAANVEPAVIPPLLQQGLFSAAAFLLSCQTLLVCAQCKKRVRPMMLPYPAKQQPTVADIIRR